MDNKWFYQENGKTVGPASKEEIADRIKQSENQPHYIWREGMSGWAEARTTPDFSTVFQSTSPAPASYVETGAGRTGANESDAETRGTSAIKHATLKERARRELIDYLGISTYLFVCFGALIFYKASILHSAGVEFTPFGVAIVKALILGKFVLMLQAFKIGERRKSESIVLANVLKKSLLFALLLFVLTVIEEMIVGHLHGKASREILSEIAGGTLQQAFAIGVLLFLILIPYFGFREISASLGEGGLARLLTQRRSSENREAEPRSGSDASH